MAQSPYSNSMDDGNEPDTSGSTYSDKRDVVHDGMPSFYSGGAGADDRPIQDNGTDGKHTSCGGLEQCTQVDGGQRAENDTVENAINDYGEGSGLVGHEGSVQNYGIENSPPAGGGSYKNTRQ